jgi:hypothetical protein
MVQTEDSQVPTGTNSVNSQLCIEDQPVMKALTVPRRPVHMYMGYRGQGTVSMAPLGLCFPARVLAACMAVDVHVQTCSRWSIATKQNGIPGLA